MPQHRLGSWQNHKLDQLSVLGLAIVNRIRTYIVTFCHTHDGRATPIQRLRELVCHLNGEHILSAASPILSICSGMKSALSMQKMAAYLRHDWALSLERHWR